MPASKARKARRQAEFAAKAAEQQRHVYSTTRHDFSTLKAVEERVELPKSDCKVTVTVTESTECQPTPPPTGSPPVVEEDGVSISSSIDHTSDISMICSSYPESNESCLQTEDQAAPQPETEHESATEPSCPCEIKEACAELQPSNEAPCTSSSSDSEPESELETASSFFPSEKSIEQHTANKCPASPFLRLSPVIGKSFIPECTQNTEAAACPQVGSLPGGFLRLTPGPSLADEGTSGAVSCPANSLSEATDRAVPTQAPSSIGTLDADEEEKQPIPRSSVSNKNSNPSSLDAKKSQKKARWTSPSSKSGSGASMILDEIRAIHGAVLPTSTPMVFAVNSVAGSQLNKPRRLSSGTVRSPVLEPADKKENGAGEKTLSTKPSEESLQSLKTYFTDTSSTGFAANFLVGTVSLADLLETLESAGGNVGFWTREEVASAYLKLSHQEASDYGFSHEVPPDYVDRVLDSKILLRRTRLGLVKLGDFLSWIDFDEQDAASHASICKAFRLASEKHHALAARLGPLLISLKDW